LKIEYPENVHLIRGNHEAADINALFGFRLECIERMVWVIFPLLFPFFSAFGILLTGKLYRERMMEYGHGHGSINSSIIFHLQHLLRRKLFACMVALEGQYTPWNR